VPPIATKQQIFEDAGYTYSFDHDVYFNRRARKVFSFEFVEGHNEAELEARIAEPTPTGGEWRFYFNKPPSEAVKRDLSAKLG
jgi:hypothetical protein